MNVAIIGRSNINGILKDSLAEEGFIPFVFENTEEITGFKGERPDFTLCTPGNNINAGYVIVTEEPAAGSCFKDIDTVAGIEKVVVFLLDHITESPPYFTVEALENAIKLARRKKQVFYLSRFMRTAGNQVESLYKQARNAGVTFIKYNDLSIDSDKESGVYHIEVSDGYDNIKVETPAVIIAGSADPGCKLDKVSKILGIKRDEKGLMNEDRSFLFPYFTGRKGIYFINSISSTGKDEILNRIYNIVWEIRNETDCMFENKEYAGIDSGKCAFCYTCYRACPHSAMAPDYENSVMKNLKSSCQACGICVSVCPANAVSIVGKEPIEENAGTNSLKILCCENSGEIAARKLKGELSQLFDSIDVVPVSCGGEISVEIIMSALKQYEKVLVLTCMDEACRHFEGNKRAEYFVKKARQMLKATGLDENRVECLKISHAMPYILRDQIEEMI